MPSAVVRYPLWLKSTATPRSFIFFDGGDARFTEAGVAGLEASIAEDAAIVVGELHDAHAELAKHFDALGLFFQERGVLEAGHDADFVFALGADDVGMPAHNEECFGMLLDQRFYSGDIADRALEGRFRNGEIDGGDSRLPDCGEAVGDRWRVHVGEWDAEGIDD